MGIPIKKTASILYHVVFYVIILTIATISLSQGIKRQEIKECVTWQRYADWYEGYYLTDWQAEQCRAHDITID